MADLLRERLLAAICTAVSGQYGLPAPEDERDLPLTIVQDGADTATVGYGLAQCVMPLNVARAEVAASTVAATQRAQAHAALKALLIAMHADPTFGGLARGVDYTGGGIDLQGRLVFAEAAFNVRYAFDPETPDVAA